MALNENVRRFRREAGLTQKELANQAGLSISMISKLESGDQQNPSFVTIRKIADVLKISPGKLVNTSLTIEEQIDEYIDYKRGLNKSTAKSVSLEKETVQEEPCIDLNFKKKLQAINGIPFPSEEMNDECTDSLNLRPEIKKLFGLLKNATKDEINQIMRLVQTFKGSVG